MGGWCGCETKASTDIGRRMLLKSVLQKIWETWAWFGLSRCTAYGVACLLLHWLIKTWNRAREVWRECKRGKTELCVSIWNSSAGDKLQLTPHLSWESKGYEGEKTTAAKLWNSDAVHFIDCIPFEPSCLLSFFGLTVQTNSWAYLTIGRSKLANMINIYC